MKLFSFSSVFSDLGIYESGAPQLPQFLVAAAFSFSKINQKHKGSAVISLALEGEVELCQLWQ